MYNILRKRLKQILVFIIMQTDFKRIKQDWSPNNQKRYTWIYNKLKEGMSDFNYDLKDYILKINKPKLLNFSKK